MPSADKQLVDNLVPEGCYVEYIGRTRYTFQNDGTPVCGAKLRNKDRICMKSPARGSNRCYLHGGKSLVGAASPTFQHGRYSKHMPTQLLERYEEMMNDGEQINLRDELALMRLYTQEMVSRIGTGESQERWHKVKKTYQAMITEQKVNNTEGFIRNLKRLGEYIEEGHAEVQAWSEMADTVLKTTKVAGEVRKMQVDKQQTMTHQEAMAFMAMLTDIVKTHVKDKDTLNKIAQEIRERFLDRRQR